MGTAIQAQRVEDLTKEVEVQITAGTVDIDMGWWRWKEILQSKIDNKLGVTGIPLRRIIRENKQPGWTVT